MYFVSKISLASLGVLALLAPALTSAQWDSGDDEWEGRRGSAYREYRERIEDLDNDIVENLPIPVLVGVELLHLTKNYGDSRGGGTRLHEGLDMVATDGTPVASPTEAVVVRIGDGPDSGLYIRTANPGGESFVYMHLSKIADELREGDRVERGEVIGFVGNTGNASDGHAHLHFEIREDGEPQDPYPRLTEVFSQNEREEGLEQALERGGSETVLAKLAPAKPVTTLVRDLEVGIEGQDVKALQVFLNTNGYAVAASGVGSRGSETTYFGTLTRVALGRYQAANNIKPAAGYFGPITRAHIAKVASL